MTMNRSQFFKRSISATASSSVSGEIVSILRLLAHCLTGDGVSCMPRPFFRSGVVTASVGKSPALSSASKTTVANFGVPKNAKLTLLFFFMLFVIQFNRFVGVKNSLKVVKFVLENMRKKSGCSARKLNTVLIVRAYSRFFRARNDAPLAANGKTALVLFAFPARHLQEFRVYVHLIGR